MRRALTILLASLSAGCGGEQTANPLDKRVPRIRQQHLGRTLDAWLDRASHQDPQERAQAAWALGSLYGEPGRRADAIRALLRDADPDVQFAAIVAAGRIPLRDPLSATTVVAALGGTRATRRQARISAVQMGPVTVPPLRAALGHKNLLVRWSAAWALARMGDDAEPAVADLVDIVRKDPDLVVRRQAARTLGRAGTTGPLRLAEILDAPDSTLRGLAEHGLRNMRPDGAGVLAKLLQHTDPEHADFAAGVFANRSDLARTAIGPLIQVLDAEGPVATDAAEALLRVGALAHDALKSARVNASASLREAIDELLARFQNEKNAER